MKVVPMFAAGDLADLVLLERDLTRIPPARNGQARVPTLVVHQQVVFEPR
jgi:hypothetical protein